MGGLVFQVAALGVAVIYAQMLEHGWVVTLLGRQVEARSSVVLLAVCGTGVLVALLLSAYLTYVSGVQSIRLRRRYQVFCSLRSLRLLGTDGIIEWSLAEKAVRVYDAASKEWTTYEEPPAVVEPGYGEFSIEGMYVDEMTAFLAACAGRAAYPYTYQEDARILAILAAVERSSDEGVHVRVPEDA